MSSEICRIGEPGCTHENVIDAINAIGVHPNQLRRFVPGEPYVGNVDLPVFWGGDDVSTQAVYDRRGIQIGILNTTRSNHELHPGTVVRDTVVVDGGYRIRTQGIGHGWWGLANLLGADGEWSDVDQRVMDYLHTRTFGP
ncbi:MAG: hypothetical protein F4029_11430 [Gammaproteobacteria bacterium]|nr:hypothetical protein [Gammaproteobacteria bacterium]MYF28225.1 hypothetical protein [Gammaproteobacteria bacterium]MYK46825.1 hypothetical protein [Gammaproteobacteria bacterium]